MNLYRSFGSLLESWATDGGRRLDAELPGNGDEDAAPPSCDAGRRSVDSGVETCGSDASSAAAPCCASPDMEGEASASPLLSSPSSPCVCSGRAHPSVEQALQRTSRPPQGPPQPLSVDQVLRRRPRASLPARRPSSELVRGQRSLSLGRPAAPPGLQRPASFVAQTGSQEGAGLSPGLSYLEQVCQMLEEVARQQMHGRALQAEEAPPQEHRDAQVSQVLQSFDDAVRDPPAGSTRASPLLHPLLRQSAEQQSPPQQSPPQQSPPLQSPPRQSPPRQSPPLQSPPLPDRKQPPHFRHRSASDITAAALPLRRLSSDCRGQHHSTEDLLQAGGQQESEQQEANTTRSWRFKTFSLRRDGQQKQPSEKNSTRRRLSRLFQRRRRRTVPV